MDIATLATTALALVTPFLTKVAEGASEKIGEDVWNLIKRPFLKKNKDIKTLNQEEIKEELIKALEEDSGLKKDLEKLVNTIESKQSIVNQNIKNEDNVEKQVNIGNNIGNITL